MKPAKNTTVKSEAAETPDSINREYSHWLQLIEDLLVRGFVPDAILMERAEIKAKCATNTKQTQPILAIETGEPYPYGPKIAKSASGLSLGGKIGELISRPLSEIEQEQADARFSIARSNRDLLASRIGRESATVAWKFCRSDCYSGTQSAYHRRLKQVGGELESLGWLKSPYRGMAQAQGAQAKRREPSSQDMDARMKQADELVKELLK